MQKESTVRARQDINVLSKQTQLNYYTNIPYQYTSTSWRSILVLHEGHIVQSNNHNMYTRYVEQCSSSQNSLHNSLI